jgi:anti-sigma regulatory factor (Ser/Thr protein kinase)
VPVLEDVLELVLPAEPATVGRARRALAAFLDGRGIPDEAASDACLLTSELVTNAISHGSREGDDVRVRAEHAQTRLRIEVDDAARAPTVPEALSQDPERTHGRGLGLLDRLADRWGERIVGGRNEVWFELELVEPRHPRR